MQIAIDITGEKSGECFEGTTAERGFLRGWKFVLICIACFVGPCLLGTFCMMIACVLCHRKVCTNVMRLSAALDQCQALLCTSYNWRRHQSPDYCTLYPGTVPLLSRFLAGQTYLGASPNAVACLLHLLSHRCRHRHLPEIHENTQLAHDSISKVQQKRGSGPVEASGQNKAERFHFAAPNSGAIPANLQLDANTVDCISSPVWREIVAESVSDAIVGDSQEIVRVPTAVTSGACTTLSPTLFAGCSQPSVPASSPPAD